MTIPPLSRVRTEPTTRPRTKITPDKYPYGKPKEATGVRFSEYQSLVVPSWLLVAIFLVFLVTQQTLSRQDWSEWSR